MSRSARAGGRPAVIARKPGRLARPTVCLLSCPSRRPAAWSGRAVDQPALRPDRARRPASIAAPPTTRGSWPIGGGPRSRRWLPVNPSSRRGEEDWPESFPATSQRNGEKPYDAIVLADHQLARSASPPHSSPAGLIRVVVTVSTSPTASNSGMFGGAVPDAITGVTACSRPLHEDDGDRRGLRPGHGTAASDPARTRPAPRRTGLRRKVAIIGRPADRIWGCRPSRRFGTDAPTVAQPASNTLVARRAPRSDAGSRWRRIRPLLSHDVPAGPCAEHAPWGLQVEMHRRLGEGFCRRRAGPHLRRGWRPSPTRGTRPSTSVSAGRSPLPRPRRTFPDAAPVTGGGPDSRAHGADESPCIREFEKSQVAGSGLVARIGTLV